MSNLITISENITIDQALSNPDYTGLIILGICLIGGALIRLTFSLGEI